jgi:hypothetical protein
MSENCVVKNRREIHSLRHDSVDICLSTYSTVVVVVVG